MQTQSNFCPFATAYSPKERLITKIEGPSMTKQEFKDECDINTIMAKYMQTGIIDFVNKHQAQYADVAAIDFQTALDQVNQAQNMFDDLPSKIRERFQNNPGAFIDFMSNPDNGPEMVSLGLATPRQGTEPDPKLAPQPGATKTAPSAS